MMLIERGTDQGYFPDSAKNFCILDTPGQEEAVRRETVGEGIVLSFVSVSRYLGANISPKEELEACVKSQVEAWAHGVRVFGKIS